MCSTEPLLEVGNSNPDRFKEKRRTYDSHKQMLVDGKPERFQFLSETYTVSTEEACRLLPGDNVFYGTL